MEFVLAAIEAMAEPNSPYDVEVSADSGHEMPIAHHVSYDQAAVKGG